MAARYPQRPEPQAIAVPPGMGMEGAIPAHLWPLPAPRFTEGLT